MAILKLDDFIEDEVAIEFGGKKFPIIATIRSMAEFEKASKEFNADKDLEKFSKKLGIIILGSEKNYDDYLAHLKSLKLTPKKEKLINEKLLHLWLDEMCITLPDKKEIEKKK